MLLIESILRHDIGINVKERIYQAAFVVLMAFFAFVIFNDVSKLPIFTHLKPLMVSATQRVVPVLKGHDFRGCGKTSSGRQEASGHDFSRAVSSCKINTGFSPEERISGLSRVLRGFSAASLVVP